MTIKQEIRSAFPDGEVELTVFRDVYTHQPDETMGVFRRDGKPLNWYHLTMQRTWWRDGHGAWHAVADIDYGYAVNILGWLERRAARLHEVCSWQSSFQGGPTADMASLAFEDALTEMWETPPLEWITNEPIYQAIAARVADATPPHPDYI